MSELGGGVDVIACRCVLDVVVSAAMAAKSFAVNGD